MVGEWAEHRTMRAHSKSNRDRHDRMWKVIVGGGIALVTGSLGIACSSGGVTPSGDAFPTEGPNQDAAAVDTTPSDGTTDAGSDTPKDTTTGTDASDGG
jgi:hypothetical protein